MVFEEVVRYRRSVRIFDQEKELDTSKVKKCLELASLAPNSSNMQLWEFYHITTHGLMQKVSEACLKQTSTETAKEIVVFVARQDLYRKRSRDMLHYELENIEENSPEERKIERIKNRKAYYGKLMPFIYARFAGLLGFFRISLAHSIGLFRPIVKQISESDMRTVVHKSCGLAAQTFMLGMAAEGYDTCPLEGFDGQRLKKILGLPCGAEINMVIPCGVRVEEGVRGERLRIPFNEVYFER